MTKVMLSARLGVGALSSTFFMVDCVLTHDEAMNNKEIKNITFFMIVLYGIRLESWLR